MSATGVSNQAERCPIAGTAKSPLGGESLTEPGNIAHPHDFYRKMRTQDPVYFDEKLGMYLVSRYEDIYAVLKDPITYSFRIRLRGHLCTTATSRSSNRFSSAMARASSRTPIHGRSARGIRGCGKLTEKAFTAHRVATLEPGITAIAGRPHRDDRRPLRTRRDDRRREQFRRPVHDQGDL